MRRGCLLFLAAAVALVGLAGAGLWIGSRILQEPPVSAAAGSPEDGIRAQQKIFDIARSDSRRRGGRPHQVVLTEAELNRFLSAHLVGVARMPVSFRAIRLIGDGLVEFKGLVPLRDLVSASPGEQTVPAAWPERQIWIHLHAAAAVEVGAARNQQRYLRFDIRRLAIGRLPVPSALLRLLPSSGLRGLLRWRIPETVDGITVEPGSVVIKMSS